MSNMVEVRESCVFYIFYHIILVGRGTGSPAMRKIERYEVQRVTGDGRYFFYAGSDGRVKVLSFSIWIIWLMCHFVIKK
jgi:hypothetical protein